MTTLYIDRSDSSCGDCEHSNVRPSDLAHDFNLGGWTGEVTPGCGATYTHVSTHYTGDWMADRVKEMRPDLPFVELA